MIIYLPQNLHWLTPQKRDCASESDLTMYGFKFKLSLSQSKDYLKKVKSNGYTILKNSFKNGTFIVA